MSRNSPQQHHDLVADVAQRQDVFRIARSSNTQKGIGQFFTPPAIARFIAKMPKRFPNEIRILDPGAGAGILTAAITDRIAKLRTPRHVELVVYETDSEVIPLLRETISRCRSLLLV